MKRYIVYVSVKYFNPIEYGCRRFKITAWLLAKKLKNTWRCDDIETIIYDRKKGDVIYEKKEKSTTANKKIFRRSKTQ